VLKADQNKDLYWLLFPSFRYYQRCKPMHWSVTAAAAESSWWFFQKFSLCRETLNWKKGESDGRKLIDNKRERRSPKTDSECQNYSKSRKLSPAADLSGISSHHCTLLITCYEACTITNNGSVQWKRQHINFIFSIIHS
jgi:hypothetical protein